MYELRKVGADTPIHGQWVERALVDQELQRADESPYCRPANQLYKIIKTDDTIEIRDNVGVVYCVLRKRNLDSAFEDISRVASLRCAYSFSERYNFNGIEYQNASESNDC